MIRQYYNYIRTIPLLIFFVIVLFIVLGLFTDERKMATQSPMIGQRVNFFDLPIVIGSETRFTPHAWEGQVAVVNFFASWCVPCVAEHAALMRLSKSYNVPIYGVAWKDKSENIVVWLRDKGNPYRAVGLDQFGKSTVAFGLSGVPETYVIDRNGKVAFSYRAQLTDAVVDNDIIPLLGKLQSTNAQ